MSGIDTVTLSAGGESVTLSKDEWDRGIREITRVVPGQAGFGSSDFMPAPDLAQMADGLIAEEPRFEALGQVEITYLWKKSGGNAKGKSRFGMTLKGTGLVGYLVHTPFVIWLAADHLYTRDAEYIEACLFHELCHIFIDEEGKAGLIGHDFEGFAAEIERYGLWRSDAVAIAEAFRQAPLGL